MVEGIFGLVGVVVGSLLTLAQSWLSGRRSRVESARYLAIRVVCVLDKYVETCATVVEDDGLCFGQRNEDGYLEPQVDTPGPPIFPEDVDWKSIDHDLMYRLLSLPNDVDTAASAISFYWDVASPPDFDEYFAERRERFTSIGLKSAKLAKRLRDAYKLPIQQLGDWVPEERLQREQAKIDQARSRT